MAEQRHGADSSRFEGEDRGGRRGDFAEGSRKRGADSAVPRLTYMYGKLLDRNRKLVEDRLDDMLKGANATPSTASSPAAAVVVPMEHARAKGPAGLHEVRTAADRRSGSPDPKGSPSGAL